MGSIGAPPTPPSNVTDPAELALEALALILANSSLFSDNLFSISSNRISSCKTTSSALAWLE
jgi:hypothetical protein